MKTISEWFDYEVKNWRSGAAISWTLILAVPITFAFSVISSFSLFHLSGWVVQSVKTVVDLVFWVNVFGILIVMYIVARLNIHLYRVDYYVPCNRLQVIWSHLSPVRILHVIIHMTCGGVVTWLATKIIGGHYWSLVQPSSENTDVRVLNEHHVFIVLHGIFVGGVFCVSFFTSGHHILQFPIIQQTKFFQVKNELFVLLCTSAVRTFRNLKYFYVIYYLFCASTVRTWSSVGSQSPQSRDNSSGSNVFGLDTIGGLLSLSLAFYTWFCGTFLDYLLSLPNLLYTVYHTEPYEFSIESTYEVVEGKCLHEALACKKHQLLQYLACLDLNRLARYSKQRRQTIFCVTRLGGHPLNWANISTTCLVQLKEFVDRIVAYNDCPSGQMSVLRASGLINPTNQRTLPFGANAAAATLTSQHNLTYRSAAGLLSPTMTNGSLHSVQQPNTQHKPIFTQSFDKLSEVLKNHPILLYFAADRPDLLGLKLFSESQKYIWIMGGLSHLASASYTEDDYGVVQQTLPEMLTILFSLLDALNRHLKQFPVRKQSRADYAAIQSLKMALKEAAKESVYRIVTTFDSHLSSFQLSADFSRKLAMFRDFKE